MILRYSPSSPFARKVWVAAIETGLDGRIEGIASHPWKAPDELKALNPLGKVPTLVTDDGTSLYDSPVICEYLDGLHDGPRLLPPGGEARWRALVLQALGDGIADAAVLWRVEQTQRQTLGQNPEWVERQRSAIRRGVDQLEAAAGDLAGPLTIGSIAAACALGYLDFRHAALEWRDRRPRLAAWEARFAARPSMRATLPGEPL